MGELLGIVAVASLILLVYAIGIIVQQALEAALPPRVVRFFKDHF